MLIKILWSNLKITFAVSNYKLSIYYSSVRQLLAYLLFVAVGIKIWIMKLHYPAALTINFEL